MLRILGSVSSMAGKISGILSFILVFLISADVFFRYFFSMPIPGTHEMSRLTLAWICSLGILYGFTTDSHVRVTLLINAFPRKKPIFDIIAYAFGLLIFSFLTYSGALYFWDSWIYREVYPAPIPIPHWLAKLAIPVGSLLVLATLLLTIISHLADLLNKED